jgi:hypothetical protein
MASNMNLLVQVTLYNDDGGVAEQLVKVYDGSYHWEVTRAFDVLGESVAKKIDPDYEG